MAMREKQITAGAIGIQKENWGNHAFFRDNLATITLQNSKIQSNVWRFFLSFFFFFFLQIEGLLSQKNAWLPQIFILETKSTCEVLLSPHSFKPRKNIPVLVGTTHRKPEYHEMRRTYAL